MRLAGIIAFCLLTYCATSQPEVTKVLSAPITDVEYVIVQQQKEYLEKHGFNSPWMRELEFRGRTDDQFNMDDYRLRLGLINPFEIMANKQYKAQLDVVNQVKKQDVINDVLKRRYLLIIEYHYLVRKINLEEKMLSQVNTQKELMLQSASDLEEIIDLEESTLKIESTLIDLSTKKQLIEDNFLQAVGFVPTITLSTQLISPKQIISSINQVESSSFYANLKKQELELERRELRIQKAEAFSNIGFIQGEYDVSRGDVFREHLGFQFGFSIPIFNSDKPELQRRTLNLIDDEIEFQFVESKIQSKVNDMKVQIDSDYQQFELVSSKLEDLGEWKEVNDRLSTDQKTYLKLAEFEHMLHARITNQQTEIFIKYIELSHLQGELASDPLINKLSPSQETFEISE